MDSRGHSPGYLRRPVCNRHVPGCHGSMSSIPEIAEASHAPAYPTAAIRKQVTVLFCDIANYTERAASMDPEELGEEIRAFQRLCGEVARIYHGHVASYHGDGIMVLFGHPNASEFSPERAVRAGLDMVAAIQRNNSSPQWCNRQALAIRIGIATGLVVVGDRAEEQHDKAELIFGNAPNLAARLQGIAKPNTVVVSLRTRRLVGLTYKFRDLGEVRLKGFEEPVQVWQVLHERKPCSRPGSILRRHTADFISRHQELSIIRHEFKQSRFGFSRFIHISGEPGIGKSRLIRTFEKTIPNGAVNLIRISCSHHYRNSFLRPISEECMRWLRINDNDDLQTRQASVNWAMSIVDLNQRDKYLLFTELLGIPSQDEGMTLNMSAEQKHRRIIKVLAQVIIRISRNKPLLLVAEDLQWADPSTLGLLQELLNQASDAPILGLFTTRNQFTLPWSGCDCLIEMPLKGLNEEESGQLVDCFFGDQYLPQSLRQTLVHKSDGVPLFIEEWCLSALRLLQESTEGNAPLLEYDVPETLQGSLNARLDQLGEARACAQLASVFAEDFTYSAIREIAGMNQIDADIGIDILIEENILVQVQAPREDRIKFRHVMLQEAAYQSLLIRVRRHYHLQIARLFQLRDPGMTSKRPEMLAHHLSRTNQVDQAVSLWLRAGELAIAKSAMVESIDHLQQGLALIHRLEQDRQRNSTELALLLNLGVALTARAGYYGHEVNHTYQRAVELADKVGDPLQKWTALYGLWRCYISRAEYPSAVRLVVGLERLSNIIDQPILRLTTYGIRGLSRLVDGKLDKAILLTDRAVAYYDEVADKQVGLRYGQDPFVTIQGLGAVTKLMSGRTIEAAHDINRSVDVANRIGHPYTIGEALKLASMYEQISRNMERLRFFSEQAIKLSKEYGFDGVLATHRIFLGFADLVVNRRLSAVVQIRENLGHYENKYGQLFLPYFQSVLAEAQLIAGCYEDALATARLMLDGIRRSGETWMLPGALLIQAEAATCTGRYCETEISEWYAQSLGTAAGQGSMLMLERALRKHQQFRIDPVVLKHYRELLHEAKCNGRIDTINHDFITRRH